MKLYKYQKEKGKEIALVLQTVGAFPLAYIPTGLGRISMVIAAARVLKKHKIIFYIKPVLAGFVTHLLKKARVKNITLQHNKYNVLVLVS
jgi:hypothetical protein